MQSAPIRMRSFPNTLAYTKLACVIALISACGCATERLATAPPKGVDLTGEWQLNPNLSDDPAKGTDQENSSPGNMRHRGGRGGGGPGGGSGGGLPPFGTPGGGGGRGGWGGNDFVGGPSGGGGYGGGAGGGGGRGGGRRGGGFGNLLSAPDHMAIEQNGGKLRIQTKSASGDLTTDEYTFGDKATVPFGRDTAERNVGWKGNVFVIDTKVKSGPSKEDDYALDDDGRLIMTTQMSGGHMPKVELKRVYDRVKAAQGVHQ